MKTEEIDEIIKKAKIINDWCIDEHPDDDYYPGVVAVLTLIRDLEKTEKIKHQRENE